LEDDPDSLAMLEAVLAGVGHHVVGVERGNDALEALLRGDFVAAVLDVHLPDMNGLDVLRVMRERAVDVPVIMLTGDSSIDAAIAALRCGAFDFVRKPFDPAQLVHAVARAVAAHRDANQRRIWTSQVERVAHIHRFLLERSSDVVVGIELSGRVVFCNEPASRRLRCPIDEVQGTQILRWIHPEDHRRVAGALVRLKKNRYCDGIILRVVPAADPDACPRGEANNAVALRMTAIWLPASKQVAGDQPAGQIYCIAHEMDRAGQLVSTWEYQAFHDPLTGLPNRALLADRLVHAIARAERSGRMVAVLFIDIDRFKQVNDEHGHLIGDKLLQGVATRLAAATRASDTIARVGGDEFVAVLTDLENNAASQGIVAMLHAQFASPLAVGAHLLNVRCSIGLATYPHDATAPEALLDLADQAMYANKRDKSRRRESNADPH
jgi:diguanylate cyclase (GGDEF)-like protein